MAEKRRIVRKVKPPVENSFDDQLWPVVAALVIMGAFSVGLIASYFSFKEENLWLNAWTWIAVVPVVVGGLIALVAVIPNRSWRRAVQLSTVLSIILHMALWVLLGVVPLLRQADDDRETDLAKEDPSRRQQVDPKQQREFRVVIKREYARDNLRPEERDKLEVFEPQEVKTPDITPEAKVEKAKSDPQKVAAPHARPSVNTSPQTAATPASVERKTPAESAPRHSDTASKLSRQVAQNEPRAITPRVDTERTRPVERKAARREAKTAPLEKATTQANVAKRAPAPTPTNTSRQPTPSVARRTANEQPVVRHSTTPTLKREVDRPTTTPRATAEVAVTQPRPSTPTTTPRSSQPTPQPAKVAVARQSTAAPTIQRTDTSQPQAAPTSTQVAQQTPAKRQNAPVAPRVAASPTRVEAPNRPTEARPNATTQVAQTQPTRSPTGTASAPLAAASTSVNRQSTSQAVPAAATPSSAEPSRSPTTQVARSQVARAQAAPAPTLRPQSAPAATVARSTTPAAVEASRVAVSSPAAHETTRPTSRPSLRAGRTAVSRSIAGTAGVGQSPNLKSGPPAETGAAPTPSVAARRRAATQNTQPGPSNAPSEIARLSRARADAPAPSASTRALTSDPAPAAGSREPSQLAASASAAIVNRSANVQAGEVNAARGSADVDFGATTQIVPSSGKGRASGGGQPVINLDTQATRLARSETGGAPQVALNVAPSEVSTTQAPSDRGGGSPPVVEASPEASSVARTESGGNLPTTAGQAPAADAGPAASAANSDLIGAARVGRPEAVAAGPGEPSPGAGAPSAPARQATAAAPQAAVAQVDTSGLGAPAADGPAGDPQLAAQATKADRQNTGVVAPSLDGPAGAVAGDVPVAANTAGEPGARIGERSTAPAAADGPAVGDVAVSGDPLERQDDDIAGPSGVLATVALPDAGPSAPQSKPDVADLAGGMGKAEVERAATGGLPVQVAAVEGPGGVGTEISVDAGLPDRRAQAEAVQVHLQPARFVRDAGGELPAVNTAAIFAADAFRNRTPIVPGGGGEDGDPKSEQAIYDGLVFLARQQMQDGSWALHPVVAGDRRFEDEYRPDYALHSNTAATGLALIAYLGAGFDHKKHRWKTVVAAGLDYLIRNQDSEGNLYVAQDLRSNSSVALYSHGIATIALCEAYAMTNDPQLRAPAQKAIDYVVKTQHSRYGGWRYRPGVNSDTSVSGWMMTALRTAELGGLDVPEEAYRKARQWLNVAQKSRQEPHLYRYNPYAPETRAQRHGKIADKEMTAVGLLMRSYVGWNRKHRDMVRGADFLLQNLPEVGTTRDPKRDSYYWYYATQVMYHMGEDSKYWETWYKKRLYPILIESQVKQGPMAGSWNPLRPVPDRWGAFAGRIYVTAMNLITLETKYRYLEQYKDLAE